MRLKEVLLAFFCAVAFVGGLRAMGGKQSKGKTDQQKMTQLSKDMEKIRVEVRDLNLKEILYPKDSDRLRVLRDDFGEKGKEYSELERKIAKTKAAEGTKRIQTAEEQIKLGKLTAGELDELLKLSKLSLSEQEKFLKSKEIDTKRSGVLSFLGLGKIVAGKGVNEAKFKKTLATEALERTKDRIKFLEQEANRLAASYRSSDLNRSYKFRTESMNLRNDLNKMYTIVGQSAVKTPMLKKAKSLLPVKKTTKPSTRRVSSSRK